MGSVDHVEKERLRALEAYEILDTPAEKDFDDLTTLASHICSTPISSISLITNDRQWLKSKVGLDIAETPRAISFCQHALVTEGLLEVKDTLEDDRFRDSNFVTGPPHIRFYAGSALISSGGYKVGTLCVMDTVPKQLTEEQKTALLVLARQVVVNLELRLKQKQLEKEKQQLYATNEKLDEFVHMVSHDLREPIMNINSLAEWLQDDLAAKDYVSLSENLGLIKERTAAMENLVQGLLQYAMVQIKDLPKEKVNVQNLVQGLVEEYSTSPDIKVHISPDLPVFTTEKVLLQQVFANLISNAFKYHHTGKGNIWIEAEETAKRYTFCVKDDGPGIPHQHQHKVFGLFERLLRDTEKARGSGIGLSTVKKIVEDKGGRVWIKSALGKGSTFFFTWPKQAKG
ncbi:GAF domain-containing sensor histidine kinase [Pontibacter saemangeumensis]|uniref:histidine kinase n=1 Tax=Pontibacter saemangeumensis TaxID=1084525 RepID=A0ABP8LGE4_9BACT